jgi:succinate dehydrogenase / fumarate reductase flavoprotein subunit
VTKHHGEDYTPVPTTALVNTMKRIRQLDDSTSGENAQDVADAIRDIVQDHAGVFRTQALLDEGVKQILAIEPRVRNIHLKDKSKVFNTARVEALEVENLYEVAKATLISAAARKECRGAHTVVDYELPADHPTYSYGRRDDEWMKHTLWYSSDNRLEYKPVRYRPLTVEAIEPKPRTF